MSLKRLKYFHDNWIISNVFNHNSFTFLCAVKYCLITKLSLAHNFFSLTLSCIIFPFSDIVHPSMYSVQCRTLSSRVDLNSCEAVFQLFAQTGEFHYKCQHGFCSVGYLIYPHPQRLMLWLFISMISFVSRGQGMHRLIYLFSNITL